jgi:hypothetical protein
LCDTLATKSSSLRDLHLWGTSVTGDGSLCALAEHNHSIESLILNSAFNYGPSTAKFIDAIGRNSKSAITNLDLSDCAIGFEGGKSIAELLQKPNCRIQTLGLGDSDASSIAELIFKALETNKSLQNLLLGSSRIPRRSFEILKDVLSRNSTLIELNIGEVSDDIHQILSDIVTIRPNHIGFVYHSF